MPGSPGVILTIMNNDLNKNTFLFLLAAIGLIVLPHFYNIPMSVFAMFYGLLIWRVLTVWKPNWLPNKFVLLLLTVACLALLYFTHHGLLGRDAGTRLFVVALGLKLMEIKSTRDFYLVTFLAFIVAASLFLYQQSILMAVYIAFVCCVLLGTLVSINSTKPQIGLAIKTAAIILLQALPMTIIIFMLFPRIPAPQWMYFNQQHSAKMGLSDSMEPGSISNLGTSDELVFRVKFTGAIPPPADRYWRGPVFSYTDGKKWSPIPSLQYLPPPEKPGFSGIAYQYTLLMEPQDQHWVFALDMPVEYPQNLRLNANYQLNTTEHPDKRAEYKITSYPNYQTKSIKKIEYQSALQLPAAPSIKINQLVEQLHGFDQPPAAYIKQVLQHFRTENFRYTLHPPLLEDRPIERFLFETRQGFCEHYATAFVYLMRAAKIPARVVTGYQGGELNKVGNFLDIKQAHAHAWTEVWLENQGWIRVDPTAAVAPERIEKDLNIDQQVSSGLISFAPTGNSALAVSWLKQARQFWGNVDYNWQRWVINYDNSNQSEFLNNLGISDLKTMMYWMAGLITVFTALLSLWLLYNPNKNNDPVLLAYQRYSKQLAKHGLLRLTGEGVGAFAERCKLKLPSHAKEIDRITQLFIKLRYGNKPGARELKYLKKYIAQFKIAKMTAVGK